MFGTSTFEQRGAEMPCVDCLWTQHLLYKGECAVIMALELCVCALQQLAAYNLQLVTLLPHGLAYCGLAPLCRHGVKVVHDVNVESPHRCCMCSCWAFCVTLKLGGFEQLPGVVSCIAAAVIAVVGMAAERQRQETKQR